MENNNKDSPTKLEKKENETFNKNIIKEKPLKFSPNKCKIPNKESITKLFAFVCITGVSLGILLQIINAVNRTQKFDSGLCIKKKIYWMHSCKDNHTRIKNLRHVHEVLERIGYEQGTSEGPWDLLWSSDYPLNKINLTNLNIDQRVNHFPAVGYIVNKVDLATTKSKYIPKAFRLPANKKEFLKYAAAHKHSMFVEKNNQHRGVRLKNVSDIDVTSGKKFVQEYMQNPFLVDGHKFDIGVYVAVTSVDPLRVYWYKGDMMFRYCLGKYRPFDPKDVKKYVVADDYLPTWEVPSLAHPFTALGNSMKEAFEVYARSKGKDTADMWEDIQKAIAEIFIMKEHHIINALKHYAYNENFFELMRFDFIVDENLKVYLLEANMSPNLSSEHFPPNQLIYEQVLYNLFSLTGVTSRANIEGANQRDSKVAKDMISTQKNIAVYSDECSTICKEDCEALDLCKLCKPCLDPQFKKALLTAHTEFLHRGDFRRLVPPHMQQYEDPKSLEIAVKDLSHKNKLLHLWYQGKCNQDLAWCL